MADWIATGLVLAVLSYTDLRFRRLPNVLVTVFAIVGFGVRALGTPGGAVVGALAAAGVLAAWALAGGRGLGAGDAKLLAALCLAVGPLGTAVLFIGACVAVTIFALGRRAVRGRGAGALPLVPFLFAAWTGLTALRL